MTKRIISLFLIFYVVSNDFIKYAYTLNGLPDYWTSQDNFGIIEVDGETKATIKTLVSNTFHKDLNWEGRYHKYFNHTYLNVVNVKRIENPSLFSKYYTRKEDLRSRLSGVAPEVSSLKGSRGPVLTTQLLSQKMKDQIDTGINEHYFFHGTNVNNVNSIANNGFRIRENPINGAMFGNGIYGAETSQKADRYADSTTDVFNMLLVRFTLGNIYSLTSVSDKPSYWPPYGYKSVMSNFDINDATGLGVFRECIVYSEDQAYPEYIIEYTRSSANKAVISFVNILFASASINLIKLTS